jgi:hypothetical protein
MPRCLSAGNATRTIGRAICETGQRDTVSILTTFAQAFERTLPLKLSDQVFWNRRPPRCYEAGKPPSGAPHSLPIFRDSFYREALSVIQQCSFSTIGIDMSKRLKEAFKDFLKKHEQPVGLKAALKKGVGHEENGGDWKS